MTLTAALILAFTTATQTYDLPPGLLQAVCKKESSYVVETVHVNDGHGDSIGICQVKVETARQFGFKGTAKQLARPRTNIHYAAVYLRYQLVRYHGDIYKAVAAYNSGTHFVNRRGETVNKKYVEDVFDNWGKEQ